MAKRVLIADDEPAILALCSRAVRSWGYEVAKASSGEEALALVKREHFDVLIADIVMPGMSGIELLQKAREVIPELAVVVITGFSSVESAIKALRAGAHDFITKPFHIEELREAIEHALQEVRAAEEHAQLRALWPLWELGQRALRQSDEGKFKITPGMAVGGQTGLTINGSGLIGAGIDSPARSLHVKDVLRLEPISAAPDNPAKGDMYMDDSTNKLMVYDGSTWQACW